MWKLLAIGPAADPRISCPMCYGAVPYVCSYLYVEDVAEAFDCVLHKGTTGEVYNIGTDKERTVLDVSVRNSSHHLLRLHVPVSCCSPIPLGCLAHVNWIGVLQCFSLPQYIPISLHCISVCTGVQTGAGAY
eukprot:GHRR01029108.1.p1 GENE.GHRR01029108.1~~GHRR01029108.1.p1  ORF type:complete len:132 (-),score=12.73 GHRR01029108.1:255-650(-)